MASLAITSAPPSTSRDASAAPPAGTPDTILVPPPPKTVGTVVALEASSGSPATGALGRSCTGTLCTVVVDEDGDNEGDGLTVLLPTLDTAAAEPPVPGTTPAMAPLSKALPDSSCALLSLEDTGRDTVGDTNDDDDRNDGDGDDETDIEDDGNNTEADDDRDNDNTGTDVNDDDIDDGIDEVGDGTGDDGDRDNDNDNDTKRDEDASWEAEGGELSLERLSTDTAAGAAPEGNVEGASSLPMDDVEGDTARVTATEALEGAVVEPGSVPKVGDAVAVLPPVASLELLPLV